MYIRRGIAGLWNSCDGNCSGERAGGRAKFEMDIGYDFLKARLPNDMGMIYCSADRKLEYWMFS